MLNCIERHIDSVLNDKTSRMASEIFSESEASQCYNQFVDAAGSTTSDLSVYVAVVKTSATITNRIYISIEIKFLLH